MKSTIYEPQEDSYLLVAQVKKYACCRVLDMGCGNGIQGITALAQKKVSQVTFLDTNSAAITSVKSHLKNPLHKPVSYIMSDLFSTLEKGMQFDTIIFNPPYLPDDELDDEKDITTGGKEGHELIVRFLHDAKSYLAPQGIILLVFSSLSKKSVIDTTLCKLNYEKLQIAKIHVFMEDLYVYLIKEKVDSTCIFHGHRGIVEKKIIIHQNKRIAVAVKKSLTTYYDGAKEATFLKLLNEHHIGPAFVDYDKKLNTLTMHFIEGERILDYLKKSSTKKTEILRIIKEILEQLSTMDILHINKLELTNPYKHIIIDANAHPVLIDFERCHKTIRPKNITQFIQFLTSTKLKYLFNEKKIVVDIAGLRTIAKSHKHTHAAAIVGDICSCLK